MALFKLWVAEVEKKPTVLSEAIHSSLQVFWCDCVEPDQAEAVKVIQMTQLLHIQLSPDRPNIWYSSVKVSREFDRVSQWLIKELREKRLTITSIQTVPFRAPGRKL